MNEHQEALTEAAVRYLGLGLKVIALVGKMPNGLVHPNGLYDALQPDQYDEVQLNHAFRHHKTTGVGILTGDPWVIDIDGEEGAVQWAAIAGEMESVPDTWVAKTGRGVHLWFRDFPPRGRSTKKLGPKLDLKGLGGYVAAPPSLHPDGHVYTWLVAPWETLLQDPPDGLTRTLDDLDFQSQRMVTKVTRARPARHDPVPGWFFPSWGFEGLLTTVRKAEEGNRNHALYWAAYAMEDEDGDEQDFMDLHAAGIEAGLDERETRLTIRSGRKAARRG